MPDGSMLKYFRDNGGPDHGGDLHWPGTMEGFPFRGDRAPDLHQEEFETIAHAMDYHSKLFELWKPEEKQAFDDVMDRIVNGWFMQHRRHDQWTDDGLAVWLEWVQVYGEVPNTKVPQNGHKATM
jgi:hypothetical protein